MAIRKTVRISKLLTRAEAMINDLADAAFMATVNCRLPLPLQTITLLLGLPIASILPSEAPHCTDNAGLS
jgi:hypothetical protein